MVLGDKREERLMGLRDCFSVCSGGFEIGGIGMWFLVGRSCC